MPGIRKALKALVPKRDADAEDSQDVKFLDIGETTADSSEESNRKESLEIWEKKSPNPASHIS